MENSFFNEVKDTVKERFNGPIFGNFLVIFLICNWRLVIGILETRENLKKIGYNSYFELFERNSNIFFPILFTVIFLFLYPALKYFFKNLSIYIADFMEDRRLGMKLYIPKVVSNERYQKLVKQKEQSDEKVAEYAKELMNQLNKHSELSQVYQSLVTKNNDVKIIGDYETSENFLDAGTNFGSGNRQFQFMSNKIFTWDANGKKIELASIISSGYNISSDEYILLIEIAGQNGHQKKSYFALRKTDISLTFTEFLGNGNAYQFTLSKK